MFRPTTIMLGLAVALGLTTPAICAHGQEAMTSVEEPIAEGSVTPGGGLKVNFRGVPLDTFLEFLSEEAGFIINREAEVSGTVDVWSHQPLSKDEVVSLLQTVLDAKGYTAIRNERTLTIVRKEDAHLRNIPVRAGNRPEDVPNTDEMVTQVIPVRHADATKLLENLQPLLPEYAIANANASSNAIVLTDTQANIRRMTEIISALDTSISSIAALKVFFLSRADAEDVADMINDLFEEDDRGRGGRSSRGGRMPFGPFGGGPPGDQNAADSEAREAVGRVIAVADENTNSVVVSAPDELMPTIAGMVEELDSREEVMKEVRVFELKYSDAEEMATLITDVYEQRTSSNRSGGAFGGPFAFFGGPGGGPGGPGGRPGGFGPFGAMQNNRTMSDPEVVAKADVRTNSVVVSAPEIYMDSIAEMVAQLDTNPARDRKVFVYSLENADPEAVAEIVRNMFEEGSSTRGGGARTTRQNRGATGMGTQQANPFGQGAGANGGFGNGSQGRF